MINLPPDRDITIGPDPRVEGHFIVCVKGVTRFIGNAERAQIVYYDLINARYSDRTHDDEQLLRAVR